MWSISSKTIVPDALSRVARLLPVAFVLALAGCQNMGSVQENSDRTNHAPVVQQTQWLEKAPQDDPPQDVWERMRRGFKLQDEIGTNPRIERQRLWFASKPSYLESVSGRGSLYVHYVVERLEERDMPLELALLPVIESSYDPFALSRSQAAGLWQFIPTTGRSYNLQQSSWYDGRRDVTASTAAAISYLSRLHEMFNGDWLLALAAYNAGEGTVSRAIERNQKLGLPTDYWNLPLPQETQDYVPKLLALSQLVKAPEAYGLNLDPIANEPYFEVVELNQRMDLSRLAALADMDADEMYQLNPAFKKRITYGGPQRLLVPTDKAELLAANLSMLKPEDKLDWQEYRVRKGDNLQGIARRHDVSVARLKELNNLSGNHLRVGQSLTLPIPAGRSPFPATAPEKALASTTSSAARTYRVKQGDNLWQIAKANKVDVNDLKRWNQLANHGIQVGQVLKLQGGTQPLQLASKGNAAKRESVTYYKVRKGDSLEQIAKRFNIEMKHLQDWNPRSGARLQPGDTLTLYLTTR